MPNRFHVGLLLVFGIAATACGNGNVYVSRFWHNHQPIYWPEWNGNGGQDLRVQYAWDSIVLKDGQTYGTGQGHPDNNLVEIFGKSDRVQSYQNTPRDSLAGLSEWAGYAISYSGSLIDNVNNLGANSQLGYSSGWWNGYREARGWYTPSGNGTRRMDMLGFTYHHSLAAVLPKAVLRKEIQAFKQAWWKAWGGNSDLSDHSRGFFPTEMAFSTEMIDVLVDEDYEWVIVPSHHLSRTCPTYNDYADPEGTFQIKSSPPNRADQLGPSPTTGWWFSEPNPGQAAWNVAPYAYQLHETQYIDPETGTAKSIIVVPSDDVLSYKAGYSGAEIGLVHDHFSPYATDPARPVIVLPSTDGDNAWGGGSSSWFESTPSFFGQCQGAGYNVCAIQDFVNWHRAAAQALPPIHVEPGAWIFPESAYGAPYYLKWIEPPLNPDNLSNCYTNTKVDLETPGFALKFWSWAPVMTGANWCETAEQLWEDEHGDDTVQAWRIAHPYDNLTSGAWTDPNIVERAWHIYLCGLDSGFNYYGGLGNDDEVKQALATRRAIELLNSYVTGKLTGNPALDTTPPTVFRPQRFPWNPGWYTFGWFNSIPGATDYLKKMPSYFYVWTHAYDVSGITSVDLKVRMDSDGTNSLATTHNETYAGGADVGGWTNIAMTMRANLNDSASLNAAADNGQIDYFSAALPPELADYYFARVDSSSLPGYKGKLLDYYIEATDSRGNVRKTDIQHVYVEDDGLAEGSVVSFSEDPNDAEDITVRYEAGGGILAGKSPVIVESRLDGGTNWTPYTMTNVETDVWQIDIMPTNNAPFLEVWFHDVGGTNIDSRGGLNWSVSIRDANAPTGMSSVAFSNAPVSEPVLITYHPNAGVLQGVAQIYAHVGFNNWSTVLDPDPAMSPQDANNWQYSIVPIEGATNINLVFNDGATTWDNNSGNDWRFAVTGAVPVVVPPGIIIAEPADESIRITNSTPSTAMEGTAGSGTTGDIAWTNFASAAGGVVPRTSHWTVASLPLVFGSNTVVAWAAAVTEPTTNATDSAADAVYGDGWISGDNGGIGWGGGWNLVGGDNAGFFIADSVGNANLDIDSPAFGMYANSGDLAQAIRPFADPLATGQTVRVVLENNWITDSNSVGFALQNSGGESLFECYFYGGESTYRLTDSLGNRDTGVGYTDQGVVIEFSLTGPSEYEAKITGTNQASMSGDLVARADSNISRMRFWNYSAGAGESYNAYFNNLLVTQESAGGTLQDTVQIYLVDPDNNLPDWWLLQHYGTTATNVAQIDTDGDGHPGQHEFWLGTDPTNYASRLFIEGLGTNGAGECSITWLSVGGRSYDVQYTDDLAVTGSFATVIAVQESSVSNGLPAERTFVDSISPAPTGGVRAYRVKLHR